jgi:hypothetical protein
MVNNVTLQDGGWNNGITYQPVIITGSLFKNTTLNIAGSANITNSTILGNFSVVKGGGSGLVTNPTVYLDYNYWNTINKPNITLQNTSANVVLNYWLVKMLSTDNAAGLTQVISLGYKAFDGTNYHDYNMSSVPIDVQPFSFTVSDGNISPNAGNLTTSGLSAVYSAGGYGVKTMNATFIDGSALSLDVNFHTDATTTTVNLSKPTGENGESVTVTVNVKGENGAPVKNGIVEFFLSGNSLGTVDVVDGVATKTIQVKGANGPYEIYGKYLGTDSYAVSDGVQVYQLSTLLPTASANVPSGNYSTNKTVTISMNKNGTIYYTLNGSTPTTASSKYTKPISIASTSTLKYFAVDSWGNGSPVYSAYYKIDKTAPTVTSNVKGGLYNTTKVVTLKINENGTIYYTLNGKTPTTTSTKYTKPVSIASSATLKYFAVDSVGNKSPVYSALYTIDKTAPKVSAVNPKTGATNVSRSKSVVLSFSETLVKGVNWSKIYIKNVKTGQKMKAIVTLSGKNVYISTAKKLANTTYQVFIPKSAVKDKAGNNVTKDYSMKFKTGKN